MRVDLGDAPLEQLRRRVPTEPDRPRPPRPSTASRRSRRAAPDLVVLLHHDPPGLVRRRRQMFALRGSRCARSGCGARRRPRRPARPGWRRTPARPTRGAGDRLGQRVLGEPPDAVGLERMGVERPADRPAVEHQRVERDAGEAEAQAVEHGDELHDLALDAGLLVHLLHRHLAGRVADVGPAGRVEPDARVGPLDQQDLAGVVADHRAHRHLRRLVAGHAVADRVHPLVHQLVDREVAAGRHPHVGRDGQHLLEPLPLVEVLGEAEPGAGDAGQRLAPPDEVLGRRRRAAGSAGATHRIRRRSAIRATR